jgi:hypothetical protein
VCCLLSALLFLLHTLQTLVFYLVVNFNFQKVRAILFVRMLTIFLQRKSSSIPTKEACPPVITAASPVTFDPNVHKSKLRRLRGSCLLRPHQVLYLWRDIRFHGISGNKSDRFRRTHQGTTRKSRKSPIATMPMKGC